MKKYLFFAILGFGLQACGGDASTTESTSTDSTAAESQATPEEIEKEAQIIEQSTETSLKAGKYCFRFTDKTTKAFVELDLKNDGSVTGTVTGSVEDHENSYFTAYDMTLGEGSTWSATEIDAKLTIEVDGDTQTEEQIWRFDGGHLIIRDDIYVLVDCSEKAK